MKRLAETTTDPLIREYAVNVVLVGAAMQANRTLLARHYAAKVASIQLSEQQLLTVTEATK